MDRAQFMKQLERLLSDISEAERQEALAYYNSYFDEAGPENEASVIRELGSPGKVAAIIKADLNESSEEYAQYTEHGYEDLREKQDSYVPEVRENSSRAREGYHPKEKEKQQQAHSDFDCAGVSFPIYCGCGKRRIRYFTGTDLTSVSGDFCFRSCGIWFDCWCMRLHWHRSRTSGF